MSEGYTLFKPLGGLGTAAGGNSPLGDVIKNFLPKFGTGVLSQLSGNFENVSATTYVDLPSMSPFAGMAPGILSKKKGK